MLPVKAFVMMDDGESYTMDIIQHESVFWLVPEWLLSHDRTHQLPVRIVSLANVPVQFVEDGYPAHYVVGHSIPKSVFDGSAPPEERAQYAVREYPDIAVPIQK